ncbi:hypothetical protein [Bifidobacterium platyrrhinorum]|uniref:Tail fiber protein n=1 Tax=Bifidobacterium platyrrhinorum TaxID=2661628 RepID=A0A6L9SSI3_9BIFI|nr:hypothetical protein [Bifidobacterium platyrrhinorum]NEG54763.1 hypothetical protein [Bifidobacterium platyrrhinorum]
MAGYEIAQYRTIETTLDLANDYTPPIRLNAGDVDGRILKFNITDGGGDVNDLNGLSAKLTWNRDPTDPTSGGGYTNMTKTAGTDNPTGVYQVSFTTPVPRALLQTAGERTVVGIDIEDADWHVIASRNIPVIIEPSRINAKASEIADPLKDLHDTIDRAQELIDTASIDIGTVTTLAPSKKATGALTGTGLKRKLNLGIPRGSKISSVTAAALDTATPTVTTGTDTNGDTTIALGLPRGKQGEKGDKGDPGSPGDVQIRNGLQMDDNGYLSVKPSAYGPITVDSYGVGINAGSGLQASSTGLSLRMGANDGIKLTEKYGNPVPDFDYRCAVRISSTENYIYSFVASVPFADLDTVNSVLGIFAVGGNTTPIGSTIGKVPCLFAPGKTFNVYTNAPMPTYSGSDEFTFTFTRLDNPRLQSTVTAVQQARGAASRIQAYKVTSTATVTLTNDNGSAGGVLYIVRQNPA